MRKKAKKTKAGNFRFFILRYNYTYYNNLIAISNESNNDNDNNFLISKETTVNTGFREKILHFFRRSNVNSKQEE